MNDFERIYDVEVFVNLRVPDRVALTALRTLTTVMGYGESLVSLAREDYYTVHAAAGTPGEAVAYVREMVAQTAVFANPNKETAEVAPKSRPVSNDNVIAFLVYPAAGLQSESLRGRLHELGYDKVRSAGRGVVWKLEISGENKPRTALDIVITRNRGAGLLINPHSEEFEII